MSPNKKPKNQLSSHRLSDLFQYKILYFEENPKSELITLQTLSKSLDIPYQRSNDRLDILEVMNSDIKPDEKISSKKVGN